MARVYVAYTYRGYEGCSRPLAVFDCPEKAEIYKAGYEQSYASDLEIKVMTVNSIKDKTND